MNPHRLLLVLLAIATAAHGESALLTQLRERLAQQTSNFGEMETLRASYHCAEQEGGIRDAHELIVRLKGPIQVVTESHLNEGELVRKDYFLDESRVYALRVASGSPCVDGKTMRVTESRFFFDKETPIHREGATTRVPRAETLPDLAKLKLRGVTMPPSFEGWGAQLTARAFSIARSFRPHVGRHVFGDWDQWLLKDAPPPGAGETPPRPAGWRPSDDTLVLPIPKSQSPDGLFAIGWGYEKGPIDWSQLASDDAHSDFGAVYFTTKLAHGDLKPPMNEDSNFLLNAASGKPAGDIGLYHAGERQRFNHDELIVRWSPSATCFVVRETGKWLDEAAGIGWIVDGRSEATFDILAPLKAAAESEVKKSRHPAAKRLRENEDEFAFSVISVLVEDDGAVEARVVGQIPKDSDITSSYYEAIVEGVFSRGAANAPALLKQTKVRILPPLRE